MRRNERTDDDERQLATYLIRSSPWRKSSTNVRVKMRFFQSKDDLCLSKKPLLHYTQHSCVNLSEYKQGLKKKKAGWDGKAVAWLAQWWPFLSHTHTHTKGEIVDTSTVKWNNRLIYLNKKTSLYIFLPEVWDFKHYRSGNNGNTVLIQVLIEFFFKPETNTLSHLPR